MIEGHRVDALEPVQVVLVGRVVAAPGHDVERRVVDLGLPQSAAELRHQTEVALAILERGDRRHEVARVGQPEGADRPELRQPQMLPVVLADVAARLPIDQLDTERHAPRHEADLAGRHVQHAQLGVDDQRTQLRHDQQFAVRVVEVAIGHRLVRGVDVDGGALLEDRAAVAAKRGDAVHEIGGRRWESASAASASGSASGARR